MNLNELLLERAELGRPIRVGLIGAGKFGTMFLAQARHIKGMQVVGLADLQLDRAKDSLTRTGWPSSGRKTTSSGEINDAAKANQVAIVADANQLIAADLDVVVECTGSPEAGTRHALAAFSAGHHVVMVTVEADSLIGPLLRKRADQAGVVYSMAYGDQPALVCELVDWARTCGFEVVAAGKGTKHLPKYHYSTPNTVFDYYGFTPQQLATGDFNAKMFNSFLDGTKSAIEMAAIANATGLTPQPDGLQFAPVGVDQLAEVLKPRSAGGILSHSGTVDVISCLNLDGDLIPGDLRWGVYVTFRAPSEYVKQCFDQYGITTDKSGEFGALYRPSHLIGLELPISVAWAALRKVATGSSRKFLGDVVACAKKDLTVGASLDGEGGETVFGKLMPATDSLARRALPMGLASNILLTNAVPKDQILSYDDVDLPNDSLLVKLRREMEEVEKQE